ncbi:fasciclin domain-containing protein [Chitinophaga qingshengii]|uniref:Fasciclin domain-containing protein n=1 Tax=Chitinophaga qingshengii TaxID=1569794 RepID=A0ABR7TI95_9BACT|nr:fasciclin domain-containing protein [Chitinophaga qingshengii]MBC9929233.1 fasciclin domain-containing protein [Chitinophaga qingshengii]
MKKNISWKKAALLAVVSVLMVTACRKNDYYMDGGLSGQSEAEMRMPLYDFLASRPNHMFDSLIKIIDLTNAKELVNKPGITFFAAPNTAVRRLQLNYTPDDRQAPVPLEAIGKDTLLNLLKRFIITDGRISLEQAVADKSKFYKSSNGDSVYINGKGGGTGVTSSIQTSAYYLEYVHIKIPGLDSIKYTGSIQTHNLITANAIVHVLNNGASFASGMKQKYYR